MSLYVLNRIDDAVSLMRSLLFPFSAWLWLKLTVVLAFVGTASGGGSSLSVVSNVPSFGASLSEVPGGTVSLPGRIPDEALLVGAIAVALVVVLGLVVGYVGAVMEFVWLSALREQELSLRAAFGRSLRRGLRLFAFRFVLGAVGVLSVAGTVGPLLWPELSALAAGDGIELGASLFGRGLLAVTVAGVVVAVVGLLHGTTTEFVAPIMLLEDVGTVEGWRRFYPTLREDIVQYVAYLGVAFVLRVLTAAGAGTVVTVVVTAVSIPFVLVAVVLLAGTLAAGGLSPAGVALGVPLLVLYLAVVACCSAAVFVPVRAFHRYHGLLVLGDTNDRFDVLAERRADLGPDFES
jgi:hypothetical protein